MTWEMDVKLNFQSTDANNLRVYVYASDTFYIQAGNNTRRVSLYQKEADQSPKPRITGRKNLLDEPYAFVSIRLTLEEGELWTLYTRKQGEQNFYEEGSYKMTSVSSKPEALMMLSFRYIKGRVSEYFIDNIKVTHGANDDPTPTPPEPEPEPTPTPNPEPTPMPDPTPSEEGEVELLEVEALSDDELQFLFDKPVDISEAVCEIGDVGTAELSYGQQQTIVNVLSPETFENGHTYLVEIEGLRDSEGRWIAAQSWEITYKKEEETPPLPEPANPEQVIISEVMADPKGLKAFPETEYVELYNTSETPVSLNGWSFIYDGKATVINELLLPPEGYAVIHRLGRPIHVDAPGQSLEMDKFPAALANSGKLLQLEDAGGVLIDELYYPKAHPGISWERFGDECYLSTDARGGTPGSPNSTPEEAVGESKEDKEEDFVTAVEPGEIVFNELLADPFTGGSEYVELYNRSGLPLSLSGLSIATRKADGTLSTAYSLSSISARIESGGYVLLTKSREGVAAFYMLKSPEVVYELGLPILANASSTLVLFRASDGGVIDEVTYSSKWHDALVKDNKGVSLERINPDGNTQDANNWTSASSLSGNGTPGYQNSQYLKEDESHSTGISPPTLREDGFYSIAYRMESSGYRCRLYIYNVGGLRVAEITNNELVGISGELKWNGRSYTGNSLPTGVYILYVELYNESGLGKNERLIFLIR
jgi:hypothetical protein